MSFKSLLAASVLAFLIGCPDKHVGAIGPQQSGYQASEALNFPTVIKGTTAINYAGAGNGTASTNACWNTAETVCEGMAADGTIALTGTSKPNKFTCGTSGALPMTLGEAFVNAALTTTVYGGDNFQGRQVTVTSITGYVNTASVDGGTKNALHDNFYVDDGTNICECDVPCSTAVGAFNIPCYGDGGTGCALQPPDGGFIVYENVGTNCGTQPNITGNVRVNGCVTQ